MSSPLITIITVNRNNCQGLRKTVASVAQQTFRNLQYVVIDGNSTDESQEVLEEFAEVIDFKVSEPDTGIYNAMNKGIARATGEYVLFLNSGDCLFDTGALARAVPYLGAHDLVYGRDNLVTDGREWLKPYPEQLDFSFFYRDTLPHSSTFIKRNLFDRFGPYDESLRISADWKFFILAVCQHQCSYRYAPLAIATFHLDGISADASNFPMIAGERRLVIRTHFPALVRDMEELQALRSENKELRATLDHIRSSRLIQALRSMGLFTFLNGK
ncbi:MAG: glycosyltransferase [Flavobacteriales bacterium]|nr:glycosyltransferase [Flavobacteriales bacterium]